jgi:hypothetical protein
MERIIRTRATGYKCGVQLRHESLGDDPEFGVIVVQRTSGKTPHMKLPPKDLEPVPDPLRPQRPA